MMDPKLFWNDRYAGEQYAYGTEPNAYLAAKSSLVRAGSRWFVPGDGEGRNGVFLARQGATVTTLDLAAQGCAKSQQLASKYGVKLETCVGDITTWDPGSTRFDGIVCVYFHLPPEVRRAVHQKLASALASGGVLVLEAFHPEQLRKQYESGGPKSESMLYTAALLREDFAGLLVDELEETETVLQEGPWHQGRAAVVRGVFRRP